MPSRCRGGIAEQRSNPQPMMNGMEKSDSVIVAVKSANKGTPVPAEPMEPRIWATASQMASPVMKI